jgi:hypothetical protein
VTNERIIELAAAQWVGVQQSQDGSLVMFRDPVTLSTLALLEEGLTVSGVAARLEASRVLFGVKS